MQITFVLVIGIFCWFLIKNKEKLSSELKNNKFNYLKYGFYLLVLFAPILARLSSNESNQYFSYSDMLLESIFAGIFSVSIWYGIIEIILAIISRVIKMIKKKNE